jgi:hypothetical protein
MTSMHALNLRGVKEETDWGASMRRTRIDGGTDRQGCRRETLIAELKRSVGDRIR